MMRYIAFVFLLLASTGWAVDCTQLGNTAASDINKGWARVRDRFKGQSIVYFTPIKAKAVASDLANANAPSSARTLIAERVRFWQSSLAKEGTHGGNAWSLLSSSEVPRDLVQSRVSTVDDENGVPQGWSFWPVAVVLPEIAKASDIYLQNAVTVNRLFGFGNLACRWIFRSKSVANYGADNIWEFQLSDSGSLLGMVLQSKAEMAMQMNRRGAASNPFSAAIMPDLTTGTTDFFATVVAPYALSTAQAPHTRQNGMLGFESRAQREYDAALAKVSDVYFGASQGNSVNRISPSINSQAASSPSRDSIGTATDSQEKLRAAISGTDRQGDLTPLVVAPTPAASSQSVAAPSIKTGTPVTPTTTQPDATADVPQKTAKDLCADRPNFISRSICESRACKTLEYQSTPYCARLNSN